jgi:hypothetical protein
LKINQASLFEEVKLYFTEAMLGMSSWRNIEKNRGQIEIRTCTRYSSLNWLNQGEEWLGLRSIFRIEAEISLGDEIKVDRKRLSFRSSSSESGVVLTC